MQFVRKLVAGAFVFAALLVFAGGFIAYRHFSANEIGEACSDNDCDFVSGEYCLHTEEDSYCTPDCEGDSECPEGWRCITPTSINEYGSRSESAVNFCARPRPEETVLREGSARVASITGTVAGVSVGTVCTWRQTGAAAASGFDSRWSIRCGDVELYGAGESGYAPRLDPSWAPGTLANDAASTATDGDPSLVFRGREMVIQDDAAGRLGEHSVTLTVE